MKPLANLLPGVSRLMFCDSIPPVGIRTMRPRRSEARLPEGRGSILFSLREVTTRSGRTRRRGSAHCPGVSCQCLRVRNRTLWHLEYGSQHHLYRWTLPADPWADAGKRSVRHRRQVNQSPLLDIACPAALNKGRTQVPQRLLVKTFLPFLLLCAQGYSLNYPTQKSRCRAG